MDYLVGVEGRTRRDWLWMKGGGAMRDIVKKAQCKQTLALQKILDRGERQIMEGKVQEATTVIENLRKHRADQKPS